jgi:putative ABC transport system ATP-binding protein
MHPALALQDAQLTLRGAAGPVEILRGVSLSLEQGESLAVVGASGSGKSSLLAVAAGLEPPSGGSVRLLGQELRGLSEDRLAKLRRGRVGVVFQAFHLLPNMTALENVMAGLELGGAAQRPRDARERARAALARVGLSAREGHYPAQLSGGEQQRAAVARAVAPGPQIVFADEPTGNLDSASGAAVTDLLFAAVRDAGAALLLITHDAALAGLCQRALRLVDGRVAA